MVRSAKTLPARLKTLGMAILLVAAQSTLPVSLAQAAGFSEGIDFFNQGEYARALPIFDKLVDKNPTDADAHFWRANCLSRLNRMKEAVAEYKLAYLLSNDPKVKDYSQKVLKQYQAMPKVTSIAAVPVPVKKKAPEPAGKSGKTFRLKTEELDWNLQLSSSFKDSLKDEHAKLDRLIAKASSTGPSRRLASGSEAEVMQGQPHNLRALTGTEVEALSRYSVVVVLDRSSSMSHPDCPGSQAITGRTVPTSRSDWCASELQIFAGQARSCFPRGVTVIPFNDNYEVIRNCSAQDLARIATTHGPSGGTELGKALEAAMGQKEQTNKRLAVIVLTDGVPNDPDRVAKTIIDMTNRTHQNEVHILFLTIGGSVSGEEMLAHFDEDLTGEGARYDAVTTLPFVDLKKNGLAPTLAKAVLRK